MRKYLFIITYVLCVTPSYALGNLTKGISVLDEKVEAQLFTTSIPYAIARQGNRSLNKDSSVQAYVDFNTTVFSISSGAGLFEVKSSNRTVLGQWPMTRWSHEYIIPEITTRTTHEAGIEYEPIPSVEQLRTNDNYNGCFNKTPLRYGDIDNNGKNDLVLLMDQDIILFSPDKKKIIFQLRWIDERFGDYRDQDGNKITYDSTNTDLPQFSEPYSSAGLYRGLRAYAKFFIGEFNGNKTPDIIVWYKVYQSNMIGEKKGFSKVRDTLRHYELITNKTNGLAPTGEYLPINTSITKSKKWLESNNLTWQKGYPNISECPGQTTKHIPEMIDPLLNDPDVLK